MDSEIARSTLRGLRRILRATETGNRRLAAVTGLTPSQLLVLREIDATAGVTPSAVAHRLQFSHATITAIVDQLVARGFVTRARGERDKRQSLLTSTREGARSLSDAPDMLQERFAEGFDALPDWEKAMILAAIERLSIVLGVEANDAAPLLDSGAIDRVGADGDDRAR